LTAVDRACENAGVLSEHVRHRVDVATSVEVEKCTGRKPAPANLVVPAAHPLGVDVAENTPMPGVILRQSTTEEQFAGRAVAHVRSREDVAVGLAYARFFINRPRGSDAIVGDARVQ